MLCELNSSEVINSFVWSRNLSTNAIHNIRTDKTVVMCGEGKNQQ
jgi:hypothetical protein